MAGLGILEHERVGKRQQGERDVLRCVRGGEQAALYEGIDAGQRQLAVVDENGLEGGQQPGELVPVFLGVVQHVGGCIGGRGSYNRVKKRTVESRGEVFEVDAPGAALCNVKRDSSTKTSYRTWLRRTVVTHDTHMICSCGGVVAAVASWRTTAIMSLMKSMLIKCAYFDMPRRTTGSTRKLRGEALRRRKKHWNTQSTISVLIRSTSLGSRADSASARSCFSF